MSERFHNKFHSSSHHTTAPSDNGLHDPIASEDNPFSGDFYLDGSLELSGGITITGDFIFDDYSLYESASTTYKGVIRFANSTEVSAMNSRELAITPNDLSYIAGTFQTSHELSGSDAPTIIHNDVSHSIAPTDDDWLVYSAGSGKWEPNSDSGVVYYPSATDFQASGSDISNLDGTWVTPEQLIAEIERNMFVWDNELTRNIPTGDVYKSTLLITSWSHYQQTMWTADLAIQYWNGSEWDKTWTL